MTDAEWAAVRPLLPVPAWLEGRGGQPEGYCHRQMLDAIRYLVAGGISWRSMPVDFPAWARVYAFFRRWRENELIAEFHDRLRENVRKREGREAEPSAGIIDAQSVKAAASVPAASRGYDGGKQVNGRKRHVITDCLGLILVIAVTAANIGLPLVAGAVLGVELAVGVAVEDLGREEALGLVAAHAGVLPVGVAVEVEPSDHGLVRGPLHLSGCGLEGLLLRIIARDGAIALVGAFGRAFGRGEGGCLCALGRRGSLATLGLGECRGGGDAGLGVLAGGRGRGVEGDRLAGGHHGELGPGGPDGFGLRRGDQARLAIGPRRGGGRVAEGGHARTLGQVAGVGHAGRQLAVGLRLAGDEHLPRRRTGEVPTAEGARGDRDGSGPPGARLGGGQVLGPGLRLLRRVLVQVAFDERHATVAVRGELERDGTGAGQLGLLLAVETDELVAVGGDDAALRGDRRGHLAGKDDRVGCLARGGVDADQTGPLLLVTVVGELGEHRLLAVAAVGAEVGQRSGEGQLGDLARRQVDDGGERTADHQLGLVGERTRRVGDGRVLARLGQAGVADPGVGIELVLAERGGGLPAVALCLVGGQEVKACSVTTGGERGVRGFLVALAEQADAVLRGDLGGLQGDLLLLLGGVAPPLRRALGRLWLLGLRGQAQRYRQHGGHRKGDWHAQTETYLSQQFSFMVT
ncbi:transposase [Streptomyces erythrochromogenes]|uniref:transposase n=2 Tax=Streptomyces TaxID=1883 RepID=UPI00382653C3